MAGRIAGITIEIGGDTTNLQKSLKGIDSQLKTTQNNLRDINKLLKLDPSNTELLVQKQKNLESAIGLSKDRLEELKNAQSGVQEGTAEWDALQREIIDNEQKLKSLEKEYKDFGSVASQQIKAVGDKMKETGQKIEDAGKKLAGISGAAAAIGGGLLKLGYDAITSADDLGTLSKQTGISTDELQKMSYASELVDVSVEDITGALRKMKTKIDPANKTFKELGVAVKNSDGSLRDATDVFYDSLKALSMIQNETERDQVAMELFGKSADQLAGIIDDGGQALKLYGGEAERLGLILDEDTISSLNDTNDMIDKTKQNIQKTMGTIGAQVGQVVAPLLEKISGLIGKVTERLRQLSPEQTETILKVVGIVAAVAPAIIIIGKIVSGIGSVISIIGTVVGVLGGPLTIAIAAIIAIGVLLYKNWDEIKAFAIKLKDGVISAWENMKSRITNIFNNIKSAASNLKDGVSNAWNNLKSSVSNVIDNIRSKIDTLKQKFDEARNKASEVVQKIKDFFSFSISLPHIRLPHIQITYTPAAGAVARFLGVDSIPHLSVAWYKKAYDNAVMFTQPTVMATPSGYKGFGDGHGAEIVMGLDKLREVVGAAGDVIINVYAPQGMDVNALADKIQQKYVAAAKQRSLLNA